MTRWPRGRFGAVLADPPWKFATYNEAGRQRCPDWRRFKSSPCRHYETMHVDQIKALPVRSVAADRCALFLWVPWPLLKEGIEVGEAWGFRYVSMAFDWMKLNGGGTPAMGMGYWTRANTEGCLLFTTRDKPRRQARDIPMAILEPRREHSRKPDCVHERIERLVEGPHLELFARSRRPGWATWGDQVGRF